MTRISKCLRLLLPLQLAVGLNAQVSAWNVRGTIRDRQGIPVAGAVVKLKAATIAQIRSFVATREGHFSFRGLNPLFDYSVQARHKKGISRIRWLRRFDAKEDQVVDLVILGARKGRVKDSKE